MKQTLSLPDATFERGRRAQEREVRNREMRSRQKTAREFVAVMVLVWIATVVTIFAWTRPL